MVRRNSRTSPGRAGQEEQKPSGHPLKLVVRRGALHRFDKLKRDTADLPVEVVWDRRQGDRRRGATAVGTDRRKTDRRKEPQFSWVTADFAVVNEGGPAGSAGPAPAQARARKSAKKKVTSR